MKFTHIPILVTVILMLNGCSFGPPSDDGQSPSNPTPTAHPILTWERTGGIAGFCDKVMIDEAGWAFVENCKDETGTNIRLTEGQLEQLAEWRGTYESFEYSQTDPATADAMTISLSMAGEGSQTADDEDIDEIAEFAGDFALQVVLNETAPADIQEAEMTLREYLTALNHKDYILGAKLYGGSPDLLHTWNPDIADDLPALFERACMQNGLVCLEPLSIAYRGIDEYGNYLFRVEYKNADGSLFRLGPCCGDETGTTVTNFILRVVHTGSGFAVLDLPPFVP